MRETGWARAPQGDPGAVLCNLLIIKGAMPERPEACS